MSKGINKVILVGHLGQDPEKDNIFIRLLSKVSVDKVSGCWNWTGAKEVYGYGMLSKGYHGAGPKSNLEIENERC